MNIFDMHMRKTADPADTAKEELKKAIDFFTKYSVGVPLVAGAALGFGLSRLSSPTDTEITTLQKQMLLDETEKQRAELVRRRQFQQHLESAEQDEAAGARRMDPFLIK